MQASDYLAVIRERKWFIIWTVVLVTLGAVVGSLFQPALYEGEAVVLWTRRNAGTAILGMPQAELSNFPDLELSTQVRLIQQPQIAKQAIRELGLGTTPEKLLEQLSVSADGQTQMITIAAVDGTSRGAARIAGAVAKSYADWSRSQNQRSITAAAKEVAANLASTESRIAELEAAAKADRSAARAAELEAANELYATLSDQLQRLESAEALETGSVSIVTSGVADPVRVSPKPTRNGALGLAMGLVLGLAMAFLANALDVRIKGPEEASGIYGAPVLGQVPQDRFTKDDAGRLTIVARPSGPVAESYRGLRNNLRFINFEHEIKTLLVTSAIPGEGKSTVASNLAVVLAQAGLKVALVFADFRRSDSSELLDLNGSAGLSEVLAGSSDLAAAIQRPVEGLRVLTAGAMPPNPSELLSSTAMERMLAKLGEDADFVIVDTPPLLAVADAAATARWADGALVVTRDGMTTRPAARRAREMLDGVGARVIGVVVTGFEENVSASSAYHAYSGYGPE